MYQRLKSPWIQQLPADTVCLRKRKAYPKFLSCFSSNKWYISKKNKKQNPASSPFCFMSCILPHLPNFRLELKTERWVFYGIRFGLSNSQKKKCIVKRISICYATKYPLFSIDKRQRWGEKKQKMTVLETKTEITLDLLDEMGTTHSEGNENTAEPKGKKQQSEI